MVWAVADTTGFQGKCPQSADKPDSAIANAPSLTYIASNYRNFRFF